MSDWSTKSKLFLFILVILLLLSSCSKTAVEINGDELKGIETEGITRAGEGGGTSPKFIVRNQSIGGVDVFWVDKYGAGYLGGNLNISGNLTVIYVFVDTAGKMCWNESCSVMDYWNGSCLIRNVTGTILEVCE